MENENILVKNLGKALNTTIKFVAVAKIYPKPDKKSKIPPEEIFFCLGIKKVFILAIDLNKSKMVFDYPAIDYISIESGFQDKEIFYIYFKKTKQVNVELIKIYSKFRANLIKNIMCYYSIYHMNQNAEIKDIPIEECNFQDVPEKVIEQKKMEKNQDIKKFVIKSYE